MDTNEQNRYNILLAEANLFQSRAALSATRIASGIYKTRQVHKGSLEGPLLNESELLNDELETMARHIDLAQQCLDNAKKQNS